MIYTTHLRTFLPLCWHLRASFWTDFGLMRTNFLIFFLLYLSPLFLRVSTPAGARCESV